MKKFIKTAEGKFTVGLLALIIGLFGYYFISMATDTSSNPVNIEVNANDHVRGAVNGKVTLVEFGDFQCPACGAYDPIVRQVIEQNKNDVKFVFKHFPLTQIHRNALPASKATEAAGLQGKYWEMHDMLYDHQEEWSSAMNVKEVFANYAKVLSLDVNKFLIDMDNKSIEENILNEYKEGVKLGVQGTPTFFLNGKKLKESPRTVEDFDALVKAEIAKTK